MAGAALGGNAGCATGIPAGPSAYGAAVYLETALYLTQRAAGMPLETPAVRP